MQPKQQLSLQNIPSSQKRRFSKTIFAPAELICNLGALQDGEHPSSTEPNAGGRLDDKNGSKRCLFLHCNPPGASLLATLLVAGTSVRVSMSPLWPILSSTCVHQSDTPHTGSSL